MCERCLNYYQPAVVGTWAQCTVCLKRYNWYHKQDSAAVRGAKRGLIYCKYRALHLNQGNVKKRERTPLSGLIWTNSRISSSRRPSSRFIRIYPGSSFWKMSEQDSIMPLPPLLATFLYLKFKLQVLLRIFAWNLVKACEIIKYTIIIRYIYSKAKDWCIGRDYDEP